VTVGEALDYELACSGFELGLISNRSDTRCSQALDGNGWRTEINLTHRKVGQVRITKLTDSLVTQFNILCTFYHNVRYEQRVNQWKAYMTLKRFTVKVGEPHPRPANNTIRIPFTAQSMQFAAPKLQLYSQMTRVTECRQFL